MNTSTSQAAPVGCIAGYARVSTEEQRLDRQLAALTGLSANPRTGEPLLFTDHANGSLTERPGLDALREWVRAGDTVRVESFSRLSRDLGDLIALVKEFNGRGVAVEFVAERLTFTGDDSPISHLLLAVLGGVYEFEKAELRRRAQAGIEAAKAKGKYKGRVPSLTAEQVATAKTWVAQGVPKAKIARDLGVSRSTLYSALTGGPVRPPKKATAA
jgi:DNA invertase Pin-like site-specific DNA recombinase